MKRRALLAGLIACVGAPARAEPRQVVLVVRADSHVTSLDAVTVRKLFLGLPVLTDGVPLRPIVNRSEPLLERIFLQHMVGMTSEAYDRQILIGINRQGRLPPAQMTESARVLRELHSDPYAVSFLWRHAAAADSQLRVVRVLWEE